MSPAPGRAAGAPGRGHEAGSRSRRCFRRLLCRLLVGLCDELLAELSLPLRVELLQLVLDGAAVVRLVPVVERLEAEQDGLADELAQHLVRRAHHPARLAVAQVALELHVAL